LSELRRSPTGALRRAHAPKRPGAGATAGSSRRPRAGSAKRSRSASARWRGRPSRRSAPWPGSRASSTAVTASSGGACGSNCQPRHCEERSDEATHAAACLLRKKSLRLLLATKGGGTIRGRNSSPAALDRFASLAMTALFAAGLGVTCGTKTGRKVLKTLVSGADVPVSSPWRSRVAKSGPGTRALRTDQAPRRPSSARKEAGRARNRKSSPVSPYEGAVARHREEPEGRRGDPEPHPRTLRSGGARQVAIFAVPPLDRRVASLLAMTGKGSFRSPRE